jgi:hypothetical protein
MPTRRKQSSLAEKLIERVEIALDGRSWPIVITHNVLIDCEELTGLNVLSGEVNLLRPSAKLVRALLYLVLRRAGAKYTLEQVGDLITPGNMVAVQEGLLTAWAASMQKPAANPTPAAVP